MTAATASGSPPARQSITTRRAAATEAGVTPATIRQWIDKGWLPAPPWSSADLHAAAGRSSGRGRRGSFAAHGTVSRFDAGCPCDKCAEAHNAQVLAAFNTARQAEWDDGRADELIAAIRRRGGYQAALADIGVTAQAVTGHRRRDPQFAARLDAALIEVRDPDLDHGNALAWREKCRCPDCRAWHDAHR